MAETTIPEGPLDFLRGVIAPMYTPVHRDMSLDYEGAKAMVGWLAGTRAVHTVFARSGMGKMFTFTVAETKRYGEIVREATKGRMGMLLGAGGEWRSKEQGERPDPERYAAQAVELTQFAQKIGADGAVHVLPQALAPCAEEPLAETIFRYYQTVHDASHLPIVIYQPPGMAPEYRLTPDLLRRLLALPRLAGMKLTTTDDQVFGALMEAVKGTRFAMVCGHEGYFLKGLGQGAVGGIGQGCNGYPDILDSVRRHFYSGDRTDAERAQKDVGRALETTRGLDGSVALKQYFIRKGVRIEPFDRSGTPPYPDDVIARVEERLDALRAPYRM